MAESCFNAAQIGGWRAFSAGWQISRTVDRQALRVLAQNGLPVDSLSPKPIDIFRQPGAPQIDLVAYLDESFPPQIEAFPGPCEYWRIPDPSAAGNPRNAYQATLDLIEQRIALNLARGRFAAIGFPLAIAS
jgi:protein-tyrosine-phosphatase